MFHSCYRERVNGSPANDLLSAWYEAAAWRPKLESGLDPFEAL